MSEKQKEKDCCRPEIYEIIINGYLKDRWGDWFECVTFTRGDDGTTTLRGQLPDQTALHSVLLKIRNMNLTLISVRKIEETSGSCENEIS